MTNSIYSVAMKTAHKIKSHFDTFGQALKAGWIIAKLFLGRAVSLTFAKECGEVRKAAAVAVGSLKTLEKGYFRFVENKDGGGTQWRSCRLERLIF